MIQKNYRDNSFDVFCTNCSFKENYETDGDWDELLEALKVDGWSIKKVDGEWEHYCPNCSDRGI